MGAVEKARKKQPTGRLLADVLRKSKKDTKKGSPHKMDATDKVKHARKKYKKFIQRGLSPIKKILKRKKP